jgi:hypothetical protein
LNSAWHSERAAVKIWIESDTFKIQKNKWKWEIVVSLFKKIHEKDLCLNQVSLKKAHSDNIWD